MKPTWGLTATIKAPVDEILRFVSYHLSAGADLLNIYLDDPASDAFDVLAAHTKVRVTRCDAAHWRGKRPKKHQVRQAANATHAYQQPAEVDWLIHMDVDEFLVSDQPVADHLSRIPQAIPVSRIRPMEVLSGDGTAFKAFIPPGPQRTGIIADIYPNFGIHLKGGFLSHLAGKVFVRTGLSGIQVRIHNVTQDGEILRGVETQPGIDLAHCHAKTWEAWRGAFDYRLEHGSYREELGPNLPRHRGGVTNHELFRAILAEQGEPGLRAFFDEVSADSPQLREKLARHGVLKRVNLDLNTTLDTHFPLNLR